MIELSDFYYIDPNDITNVFKYPKKIGINVELKKNETEKYIDWIFYTEKIFEDQVFISPYKAKYHELRYNKTTKEWFHIQYKFRAFYTHNLFDSEFIIDNTKDTPFIWRKNLDPKTNTIIGHYLYKIIKPEFIETIYSKIDIYEFFLNDTCYNLRKHFETLLKRKRMCEMDIKRKKKFICKFLHSDKRLYIDIIFCIKKYIF